MLTAGQAFERYRVGAVLGEGGFAIVYDAYRDDGVRVALKVLKPDDGNTYAPQTRARFLREIGLIAQLHDPHTVRLLDSGDSGGLLWMAFEHVSGRDLAEALEQFGTLPAVHVEHILRQLLASLREAHLLGIIHRDLKPQNIRVFLQGNDPLAVKLLDFGIARAFDEGHPSVTKTGELVGTPRYMSPEQLLGRPLTAASDIYCLGVVAVELLCGSEALAGNSILHQIERIQTGLTFKIGDADSDSRLGRIIGKMTANDVSARYSTAAAVLAALDQTESTAVQQVVDTPPTPSVALDVMKVLILAVVVLSGVAAWLWTQRKAMPEPIPTTRVNPLAKAVVAEPPAPQTADGGTNEPIVESEYSSCGVVRRPTAQMMGNLVYAIPDDYDPETRYPLVIALHSEYQKARTFIDDTRFAKRAREGDFIVIAPSDFDGLVGKNSWHDKEGDLEKIRADFQLASDTFCIDPERVWVAANDYGGRAAMVVSCEPWVAGVAIHASTLRGPTDPNCATPKPLLWMHPMHSPSVPVDTTTNCNGHQSFTLSETRKRLKSRNNCRAPQTKTERRGDTYCETWSCDVKLEMCYLDGGNLWTGMNESYWDAANRPCQGDVTADYDLTEKSLQFFGIVE